MVNVTGFSGTCGPMSLAGIRPVLIWKSTAAAPTPTRLGACEVPEASTPWHEEHVTSNRSLPSAIAGDDTNWGWPPKPGCPGQ